MSDYSVVDEQLPPPCSGGGCVEGGPFTSAKPNDPDGGASSSVDSHLPPPNECDPARDGNCIDVPTGFSLVALTDHIDPSTTAQCPTGFDSPITVGATPTGATQGACGCTTCNVTTQATCPRVLSEYGPTSQCTGAVPPTFYENDPPNCKNTNYTTAYLAFHKFRFDAPSGGACTPNPPTKNLDAVVWNGSKSRMCTSTAANACEGGRCKVSGVVPPYRVCLSSPTVGGECPAGFAMRSVLGPAEFDCDGAGCSCTVNRAACAGKMFLYSDNACAQNEKEVPLDNVCQNQPGVGGSVWPSFKTTGTSQTTCTSTGNPTATNVRLGPTQTICCR